MLCFLIRAKFFFDLRKRQGFIGSLANEIFFQGRSQAVGGNGRISLSFRDFFHRLVRMDYLLGGGAERGEGGRQFDSGHRPHHELLTDRPDDFRLDDLTRKILTDESEPPQFHLLEVLDALERAGQTSESVGLLKGSFAHPVTDADTKPLVN